MWRSDYGFRQQVFEQVLNPRSEKREVRDIVWEEIGRAGEKETRRGDRLGSGLNGLDGLDGLDDGGAGGENKARYLLRRLDA